MMPLRRSQSAAGILTVIVLSLLMASGAPAAVLFSNLGPGDTYNLNIGWTLGLPGPSYELTAAMPFVVSGGSYSLSGIELAASQVWDLTGAPIGPNALNVWLAADAAGLPGATLESFSFVGQLGRFGDANPLLAAGSLLEPLLADGSRYWLVAAPPSMDTWAAWNLNTIGQLGGVNRHGGDPWMAQPGHETGAFRIIGTPVAEPDTRLLVLAGLGVMALAGLRRRA